MGSHISLIHPQSQNDVVSARTSRVLDLVMILLGAVLGLLLFPGLTE